MLQSSKRTGEKQNLTQNGHLLITKKLQLWFAERPSRVMQVRDGVETRCLGGLEVYGLCLGER